LHSRRAIEILIDLRRFIVSAPFVVDTQYPIV